MAEACCLLPCPVVRTSLRDLGKGQTGAPLEIDVIREDQGAQGSKRLAGEEVGLATL